MTMLFLIVAIMLDSLVVGHDPVRRFTPADYQAAFQNWDILQVPDGRLMAANTDGVLVYDGVRWMKFALPAGRQVRTLALDAQGVVWVGAEGWLGRMLPDRRTGFRFDPVAEDVQGDVWSLKRVGVEIYAQATDEVLWWHDGRLTRLALRTGAFPALWVVDGEVLVEEAGIGWIRLDGDRRIPVSGLEPLSEMRTVAFLRDGTEGWYVITRDDGLYRLGPNLSNLVKVPVGITDISSAIRLKDGRLAIGTVRTGLHVLNPDTWETQQPGQEVGMHLDAVWSIIEDRESHIWLATDRGLVQWYRYADLDMWDSRSGLTGNIQAFARFDGRIWVGTSTGLFIGERDGFRSVRSVTQPVWSLLEWNGSFLIGTAEGLGYWDGSRLRSTAITRPVYSLLADRNDPTLLWIGTAGGVIRAGQSGGRLRLDPVRGADLDVRQMVQSADGTIWGGTLRGGVIRISDGLASIELPTAGDSRIALSEETVYAGNMDGLWRWNPVLKHFEPTEPGSMTAVYRLTSDPTGTLWMVRFDSDGSWIESIRDGIRESAPYRRLPNRGLLNIVPEAEQIWIGTTAGLYRLMRPATHAPSAMPEPVLSSLTLDDAAVVRFGSPWLEDPASIRYRYRFEGDSEWTDWSTIAEAVLINPWEGEYRLNVEARNKYGDTVRVALVEFTVPPPVYRTPWAYAAYALLTGLAVFGAITLNQRVQRARSYRLIRLVRDRTNELARKEDELRQVNRALSGLVDQKNTILGIAAHDLRNPLATIEGFAELITAGLAEFPSTTLADLEELKTHVAYIQTASADMSNIIDDLLDAVLIEKGRAVIDPKAFELAPMLDAIVASYEQIASRKGIVVHRSFESRGSAYADPDRMREVFLNLLSNAVKYTHIDGEVTVSVVDADQDGHRWAGVVIRDQGPGFTELDRAHMFGMFKRLSAFPTGGERSNGVGLYIVKHFTELNGGRIDLVTEPGEGSAFTVWLPAPPDA